MCKAGKRGFEKVLWLLFIVVMSQLLWMVINLFYFVRFLTKKSIAMKRKEVLDKIDSSG